MLLLHVKYILYLNTVINQFAGDNRVGMRRCGSESRVISQHLTAARPVSIHGRGNLTRKLIGILWPK